MSTMVQGTLLLPTSMPNFMDLLQECQLLHPGQIAEIARELLPRSSDPQALCQQLVQREWLTHYQAHQLLAGQGRKLLLGPYCILELLGEGGAGQVFKAVQLRLNRVVALKLIRPEILSEYDDALRRFRRESRTVAQLSHPNFVTVYDASQVGEQHFIAMEYIEGIDLGRLVRRRGPLPLAEACEAVRQAALGLQYAHEQGVVHRDIKPSNLMVARRTLGDGLSGFHPRPDCSGGALAGRMAPSPTTLPEFPPGAVIKILDMGLARLIAPDNQSRSGPSLTREGALMGTPDFMAPEQARNARTADIRADLYSLGCTFYFLLTARPPFPEGAVLDKLLMHQLQEPRPAEALRAGLPAEVAGLLRKLMAKRPEARFQTPAELIAALDALPEAPAVPSPNPTRATEDAPPPPTVVVRVQPIPREVALASATRAEAEKPITVTNTKATPGNGPGFVASAEPAKTIALLKGYPDQVTALAFSPDRYTLAAGNLEGTLRLWSFAKGSPEDRPSQSVHGGKVSALAFAPDCALLASASGGMAGTVCLWDLNGRVPVKTAALPGPLPPVESLAFSPDGKLLAVGKRDGTIRLWAVSGSTAQAGVVLKGHTHSVTAVEFARDGVTLASSSQDGTARLWDLRSTPSGWFRARPRVREPVVLGNVGNAGCLQFTRDHRLLVAGGADQTVRLWDLTHMPHAGEPATLTGHRGTVCLVKPSQDGQTLLSADDTGLAILWEMASGKKLRLWQLCQAFISSIAATLDCRYLATGHGDGKVAVIRLYSKSDD
jgi:serine/threonine-protein kinase